MNKIVENILWFVFEKAVRATSTLFVTAMVIKYLGPERYGTIAFYLGLSGVLLSISSLGIEGNLIREIINAKKFGASIKHGPLKRIRTENHSQALLISSVFYARFAVGTFAYLACLIFCAVSTDFNYEQIQVAGLVCSSLILQAGDVIELHNQSELLGRRTAISRITSYVTTASLRITFVLLEVDFIWLAFSYLFEYSIIFISLVYGYLKRYKLIPSLSSIYAYAIGFLSETWVVIVATFLTGLGVKSDQFILSYFYGPVSLGVYASAVLFGSATFFLPGIICGSAMSTAAKYWLEDKDQYYILLRNVFLVNLAIAILVTLFIWFFAPVIIVTFYDDRYMESISLLRFYAFVNIPIYLGITHSIWIINEHKLHLQIVRASASVILTIGFAWILVPRYEAVGSIAALLISVSVSDVFVPVLLNRELFKRLLFGGSAYD
jgi:O-antigen/teichoic acid export membrane protein